MTVKGKTLRLRVKEVSLGEKRILNILKHYNPKCRTSGPTLTDDIGGFINYKVRL